MVASLTENAQRSFWDEWARITCPTLAIWGQRGIIPAQEVDDMFQQRPDMVAMSIPEAGHDVHLEHPDLLRQVLQSFLEGVNGTPAFRRSGPNPSRHSTE
ncbi:alpha/beta hydrolase [Streptomyces sp. NPDC046931]|uniref:alpha/beta fold hydrolase n=1 Tax=Streptomyces sp. NPDC046931 TaxID=3154806 RepID=UPI0033F2F95B